MSLLFSHFHSAVFSNDLFWYNGPFSSIKMNKFDKPTLLFVSSILPLFTFGIQKLNLIYRMDLPLPPDPLENPSTFREVFKNDTQHHEVQHTHTR